MTSVFSWNRAGCSEFPSGSPRGLTRWGAVALAGGLGLLLAGCGSGPATVIDVQRLGLAVGETVPRFRMEGQRAAYERGPVGDELRVLVGFALPGSVDKQCGYYLYLRLPSGTGLYRFSPHTPEFASLLHCGKTKGVYRDLWHVHDGTIRLVSRYHRGIVLDGTFDLQAEGMSLKGRFSAVAETEPPAVPNEKSLKSRRGKGVEDCLTVQTFERSYPKAVQRVLGPDAAPDDADGPAPSTKPGPRVPRSPKAPQTQPGRPLWVL